MKRVVVSGIAGLAIGALVVGLLWLTLGGSSRAGDANAKPVTAPARVGEFQRFADQQGATQAAVRQQAELDRVTAQHLSAAYHGAAATAETYVQANGDPMIHVLIVRAPSPELFPAYEELNVLGMKVPEVEVKVFGDVHCIVRNDVGSSQPGRPVVFSTECQRSDGDLTVHIPAVSAPWGANPQQVAAVVDAVFTAIG